jgi:hypothetical protein
MGTDWRGLGLVVAAAILVGLLLTAGGCAPCQCVVAPRGIGAVQVQSDPTPTGGSYFDGCNTWTRVGENTWNVTTLHCDKQNAIKVYSEPSVLLPYREIR